jgi:hypothetical protein
MASVVYQAGYSAMCSRWAHVAFILCAYLNHHTRIESSFPPLNEIILLMKKKIHAGFYSGFRLICQIDQVLSSQIQL